MRSALGILLLTAVMLALGAANRQLYAQDAAQSTIPQAVDWIEPRGINVVDLVGLVPQEHLQGAIVRFQSWFGVALYEAGERNGDIVTLTLRMETGQRNVVFCPGRPGERDEWPSVAPAGTARIYAGSSEITGEASWIHYYPGGQTLPIANATSNDRYPLIQQPVTRTADGALMIPVNMGCIIFLNNPHDEVRVEFVLDAPQKIRLTPLGSQTMEFHSYIGVGNAGKLASLSNQMSNKYGSRHDEIGLQPPAGTDFFLANFPTTPVNPYGDPAAPISPGGGTYRIRRANGKLSVDHTNTMGLPLYGQFQDADQSSGTAYLPFFSDSRRWTSPEYFVPTGVAYDPCMTNGGCSSALLETIHDATMQATVYYYDVERIAGGMTQIPIKQVGPNWSPARSRRVMTSNAPQPAADVQEDSLVYLPTIVNQQPPEPPPPDDPTNCPCGWFDENGAMFAFVPAP